MHGNYVKIRNLLNLIILAFKISGHIPVIEQSNRNVGAFPEY